MPLNHCFRVAPPCCVNLVVDFSPCRAFSVVPFFPAPFLPVIIPVINFPFDTSTMTSFLPFIFPPVTCTSLLSCLIAPLSVSTVTYSPVTFLQAMVSVVLSPFVFLALALDLTPLNLLSSSFLSLHCSFWPLPSVSLVILISIPFTIPVSLANSAVRHSTFQHPVHWKVKSFYIVVAHDFVHSYKAKSTKLWQWSHTKCLLAFTCRLQGAILCLSRDSKLTQSV